MKQFKVKKGSHVVLKVADIEQYLDEQQKRNLDAIIYKINARRNHEGKKTYQEYYVVNCDEPYAKDVLEVIKKGEMAKE